MTIVIILAAVAAFGMIVGGIAAAYSCYNNKRSFSVHVGDNLVGTVHCMSGGRYVGLDSAKNEICSYSGQDAEVKCFVEVARYEKA